MDFLKIIDEKLSKAEEDFIANSDNNLNNCKQLLDYIYALKNIQSLYRTVASDGDTSIIVDTVNNGASKIESKLGVTNNKIETTNNELNATNSKLESTNTRLAELIKVSGNLYTMSQTIKKQLDDANIHSIATNDCLEAVTAQLIEANGYLKTISEK